MYLNVWLVIWPTWQVSMGRRMGDAAEATRRGRLASRTNLLFAAPMLFFMGGSAHLSSPVLSEVASGELLSIVALIAALELNGLKGRFGPLESAGGAIASSLSLTLLLILIAEAI